MTAIDAVVLALFAEFRPRLLVCIHLLFRESTLLAQILVSYRYTLDLVIQTSPRSLLLGIHVCHRTHNLGNIDILGLNSLSREARNVKTCVVFHLLGRASQIVLFTERLSLGLHCGHFLILFIS